MAIVLRTVTGSALTHTQVDTNFASFYYSSSLTGQILTLFTTGSTLIGQSPTSTSFTIPSGSKWTDMVGGGITRNSFVSITGSFAQGHSSNKAIGANSHAQGRTTTAAESNAHAEGEGTTASGSASHAEGNDTSASAYAAHAEGISTVASGRGSHAEGGSTIALRTGSHAEGTNTSASGDYSHAEGSYTIASGSYSHAEGISTIAVGDASHAEGQSTQAIGNYSHAEGLGTIALGNYQHVQGRYNITSSAESAFIIGNGTNSSNKKNLVFASGSTFQVSGSLLISGTVVLPGDRPIYFGTASQGSTSSYAIFRDLSDRLTIGNNVQENYGSDGIKINTSGKVQLNHVIQNYGLYDTTLNIVGSGSNDGITLIQYPDTSNRYTITVESGSVTKLNFQNLLHPASGSFNFSGSVAINDILSLTRRTTTPTPVEGMIIASGSAGASKVYYYNGTSWNALF